MRKWVEYQLRTQQRNTDWENRLWRFENVADKLGEAFERIKQGYKDKTLSSQFENVFLREDYIARTAASTGGDVSENDFRKCLILLVVLTNVRNAQLTHYNKSGV